MNPSDQAPNNPVNVELSTQTTRRPASFLQRAVWTLCLMIIGSVLAIHGALAYSPEFAKYVPEVLIKQSPTMTSSCASQQACSSQLISVGGCRARAISPGDYAGCCSMRASDRPLLTDGLYREDGAASEAHADLPVDALDCLPATPEATDPQAGISLPVAPATALSE